MATQQTETPQAVAKMVDAAKSFINSLNAEQKAKASFEYMDGERIFWYYPPMNRHGLPLRDMEPAQRELAMAVMASGLTSESYEQANSRWAVASGRCSRQPGRGGPGTDRSGGYGPVAGPGVGQHGAPQYHQDSARARRHSKDNHGLLP